MLSRSARMILVADTEGEMDDRRLLLSDDQRNALLDELCVRLGFCLLSDACCEKLERSPLTVDEFTDAVLADDGDDVGCPRGLRRQVRELVAQRYESAAKHGLWWPVSADGV